MNAQSWFGVGVRLFGCYLVVQSLFNLAFYTSVRLEWSAVSSLDGREEYLLYAVCYAAVGLIVIRHGDVIARFAYPVASPEPNRSAPIAEEPRRDPATGDADAEQNGGG